MLLLFSENILVCTVVSTTVVVVVGKVVVSIFVGSVSGKAVDSTVEMCSVDDMITVSCDVDANPATPVDNICTVVRISDGVVCNCDMSIDVDAITISEDM